MAAEFQMKEGGEGGRPSSPSFPHKKGLKIDKTIIYVVGAVVIVVFLLLRGKSNSQQPDTAAQTYITDGYPDNNVDTAAQLSNFQDIMTGQVDATLNGFSSDLNSELNQLKLDIGEQNKDLIDKSKAEYQTKLDEISKQNEQLAAQMKNMGSSPVAPAPAAPTPKPAAPAAPSGPSWLGSLSRASYATPRGGWNGNSVVDHLKSKGYAADMGSRSKLAAAMGIGGYSGTTAQNIQMLNNLKSAGL